MYEWPVDQLIHEWATWAVEAEFEKLRQFIDEITPVANLTNSWDEYEREIKFMSDLRLELMRRVDKKGE